MALLSLVVFAGIAAPWIAPHDPEQGELRDRNIPPVWFDSETATKTVVEKPTIEGRTSQITLRKAREQFPNAQLGDEIEVVAKEGGSAKFLLGTDGLGRDVLSRIIYGARISIVVAAVTLGIGGKGKGRN